MVDLSIAMLNYQRVKFISNKVMIEYDSDSL